MYRHMHMSSLDQVILWMGNYTARRCYIIWLLYSKAPPDISTEGGTGSVILGHILPWCCECAGNTQIPHIQGCSPSPWEGRGGVTQGYVHASWGLVLWAFRCSVEYSSKPNIWLDKSCIADNCVRQILCHPLWWTGSVCFFTIMSTMKMTRNSTRTPCWKSIAGVEWYLLKGGKQLGCASSLYPMFWPVCEQT